MIEWLPLESLLLQARPQRMVSAGSAAISHAQFCARVAQWRQGFANAGGNDFAVFLEDAIEFSAALLGAWHAHKRVFLCGDTLPLTVTRLQQQVDGFAGDFSGVACVVPLEAGGHQWEPEALDVESTRLVVFTSGSSGEPAAIEKNLRQLASEVQALEEALGPGLGSAQVHGTVSHQHIYGLLFRILWPLCAGRVIAARTFFPEDMLATLAAQDSILIASPAHLTRLPVQRDGARLHGRLKAVFSSGGTLPAESAIEARERLGVPPTEIYGSSETGGIAWRRWDTEAPVWRALPAVEWRIEDQQLQVRSPHLPTMDWWPCHDRVEADPGQQGFRLLGRADRIVKIEERRVSLDALEQRLREHESVADARVFILSGQRNLLAAVIVPSQAGWGQLVQASKHELAQQLGKHLSASHDPVTRPRQWRFVETLPLNAQGKTTAQALSQLFRPQQPIACWLLRDAEHASLELLLDPALMVFEGHFPQVAILPGVAQLDWAIRFAREAFEMPPRFVRMESLKFQNIARAGETLQLDLQWHASRACLEFRYRSDHGVHASGKVMFADEPARLDHG